MIQSIRSFKTFFVEKKTVITVSTLSNTLFFTPDPTNIFEFDPILSTFSTSVAASVISIEFTRPFEADGSINEYIENGHHVSYNDHLTENHPTHVYRSFIFINMNHDTTRFLISSGLQSSTHYSDFMYKSIPFAYETLSPLIKQSRLVYDLDTEFPEVSRLNSFTLILQIRCNVLTSIKINLFSDDYIHLDIPASVETNDIHVQYDAFSQRLMWTQGGNVFSIPHTNSTPNVEILVVRTVPNAIVSIYNLIVLPGEIKDSRINSISENNIFIGNKAGFMNQNGTQNIFIGNEAGGVNTSGKNNIFVGDQSGAFSTIGQNNVCLGTQCGYRTESDKNVFIGYRSGMNTTKGGQNIFIGKECGLSNTTGSFNICLGNDIDVLGNNNIFLTNNLLPENKTESDKIQIGNLITGNMKTKEIYINGSLFVDDRILHPVTKNIRVTLILPENKNLKYTAILDTGCDKINLIQRIQRETGVVNIDCKASLSSSKQISIICTRDNEIWYTKGQLTSDETMQDLFQIEFGSNTVEISTIF
jgi:hypothetical protein